MVITGGVALVPSANEKRRVTKAGCDPLTHAANVAGKAKGN